MASLAAALNPPCSDNYLYLDEDVIDAGLTEASHIMDQIMLWVVAGLLGVALSTCGYCVSLFK